MRIEKIKKLKNGKYKLELDNKENLVLYDEVILNNNLLFNKNINDDNINKIYKDNNYYDDYYKVLKYALYKMRSYKEIKEYMDKYNIEEQNKIISKLKENNIINDEMYVKAFIADRINLSNDGPYKIKNDLKKQNIDDAVIDHELNNYESQIFNEKVKKIIDKKSKLNTKYSLYSLKQKLLINLINMGYSREMIIQNFENLKSNNNIIDKEYSIIYRRLSRKYKGDELEYQIKNKLYQKGFSSDDINNIKK